MVEEIQVHKSAFVLNKTDPITKVYVIKRKLGDGSYGQCYLATHKTTGMEVAIKQLPRNKIKHPERLATEVKILSEADHPNITKLYEKYEDPRNVYLVMEVCNGGELFDAIVNRGHLTERIAAEVFQQMAGAIRYLHANGIVHRDLKPENLLLSQPDQLDNIKLIDFGLSKVCENQHVQMHTRAGTPYYIAPEVLEGSYGMECDIWSLGVILYILVSGYPPYHGSNDSEILRKVRANDYNFDSREWTAVSSQCRDLISKMLVTDVQQRLNIEQVFEHEWMTMNCDMRADDPLNIDLLKQFSNATALKKSVLMIIANQCSERDIARLKDKFNEIDRNHDGTITYEEFREALGSLGINNPEIEQLFAGLDVNHDGLISYSEFLASTMEKNMYMNEERLWNAFQVFDRDNSGKISAEELRQVLASDNADLDCEIFTKIIQQFDISGDQEIDFEEFKRMMEQMGIIRET